MRIRAQYSLVIGMGNICIGNHFTKLCCTNFAQQNLFLTSHIVLLKCEYLKVIFISLLDFYYHIRSYFTKLQVTLNFSDKLHILNTNNIVKSHMLILNNLKIQYKDTIQVCLLSYRVRKY